MRNINYILINETHPHSGGFKCRNRLQRSERYHYIVNSAGVVLNPIDIHLPGAMDLKPREPSQRLWFESLNDCSIGVLYNGSLSKDLQLSTDNSHTKPKPSTFNAQLSTLIALLVELRERFPTALILGVYELDRWHTRVSNSMNQLRLILSNEP